MSDPLRMERPRMNSRGDDLGDVLASIRKLIAQDGQPKPQAETSAAQPVAAPVASQAEQPVKAPVVAPRPTPVQLGALPAEVVEPLHTPSALPAFDATEATRLPPLSPDRTAALTTSLADAVDAAAARMAETTRRIEEVKASRPEAPLRLRPDALIPAAPTSALGEARPSSPPKLSVVATEAVGPAYGAQPQAEQVVTTDASDYSAQPAAFEDVVDLPESEPTAVSEMPPTAAEETSAEAEFNNQNKDITEPPMDAHPLRHMLRDAIREELRGELAQEFNEDLRRIVREELATVLTEAFGKTAG